MPITPLVQDGIDAWNAATVDFGPLLRGEPGDWAAARAAYLGAIGAHPTPEGVTVEEIDMGGIAGTLVTPGQVGNDRVLLYIHGGGYVAGGPAGYHGLAGNYAKLLKARVYMPDYRLAPEYPFPRAIDDTLAAYRWLLDRGVAPGSIAFSGDSAGGALVVTVMVAARNAGLPLPAAGVAISPWANLEHTGSSMRTRDGLDPAVTAVGLDLMARTFLGGALRNSPEASPVFADVRGLPPILIQIGENEVMLSDAIRLAGHLAENRVRVSLDVWPGMFHVWHMFAAILPEGLQALRDAASFLDTVWQGTTATARERGGVRYADVPAKACAAIAEVRARPGKEQALRDATLPLVAQVRAEPNNLLYVLHEDSEAPGHFLFYEIFASRADFAAHGATPHVQAWFDGLPDLAEGEVRIVQMDILGNRDGRASGQGPSPGGAAAKG